MFGLKLRSWMDNIVRNKKSKSKKQHSTGTGIMVGSPTLIRRVEISPLQNTAGGRAGWKTPDSPGHGKIESATTAATAATLGGRQRFDNGNGGDPSSFRCNYRTEQLVQKKVIIETRVHSKRTATGTEERRKHYSHSSASTEFGSVMNYISSPESAYSTGYSTLHSDDCTSPAQQPGIVVASGGPSTAVPQLPPALPPKPDYLASHNNNSLLLLGPSPSPSPSPYLSEALSIPQINCPSSNAKTSYVDSPSPRQRPRIRTNPWWYKTAANNHSNSLVPNTSSGAAIHGAYPTSKSSSPYRSQSNCSSPSRPTYSASYSPCPSIAQFKGCDFERASFTGSPNSVRKRKLVDSSNSGCAPLASDPMMGSSSVTSLNNCDDDDSTLKEIMGRFDEISYTYDKETDILTDSSDHTQCQDHSDYEDTGQDAEDEYEEEIDFIDKHATSISESVKYKNSGSCQYYDYSEAATGQLPQSPLLPRAQVHAQAPAQSQQQQQVSRASLKLRKRFRRKRSECNTPVLEIQQHQQRSSQINRECRSVGGTPILNRRSGGTHGGTTGGSGGGGGSNGRNSKKHPLIQLNNGERCNSLTTLSSPQKTLITIAESEKQLLKGDLEILIKYRELITEAETLLGSFASAPQPATDEARHYHQSPVAASRNAHPHLPNKRVEMLRAEVSKRSSSDVLNNNNNNNNSGNSNNNLHNNCQIGGKQSSGAVTGGLGSVGIPSGHNKLAMKPHSPLPVHRKIELLKQEQFAFGPPQPSPQSQPQSQAQPMPLPPPQLIFPGPPQPPPRMSAAKENYPPPYYSPKPVHRNHIVTGHVHCPKSEPVRRKVYVPANHCNQELFLRGSGKQEMLLKTLEDLKRSLEDQKTQLFSSIDQP